MAAADLEMVLAWRNHPKVRRYMYTQHEISLDEHCRWFEQASLDPHRHLLLYEDGPTPLGFVNIYQSAPGGIADWGFYTAPDAPDGTGRMLGNVTLRYAFSHVSLHKLCGQALALNERSVQFHRSLGFTQEGTLRQQHFDGQHYHDVLCFGLLAQEWLAKD
ncbi:UDP-4-amino-4,6-dideoxy-N-acetyl-beta-L-altrosamine N-acetyltransferase [Pollutimonas sp. M17]|uniref:UDP-4-amino-4, 6-dideoxy-N-acetyl-beta-L-altrosamine N-acetyltransferase n=1 Tax=Pollutimonas sp. M17 TaxID=2962065 RepID=UPI0021F44100|nr:UDP-4-amino-4,6-dideoxy-N-acetyl-beta-L-altrosamine N-acetyltransferase [Pollutimonas sp. M17]UYO93978.1 UDP-4-amino-4,6-dideoxy-N-acetyl-beta-L-altrosamine N-acetyltransferase [Pollutimonas sp. M17]